MEFISQIGYNYLDKWNKLFLMGEGDNTYLSEYIGLDLDSMREKNTQANCRHCIYIET